MLVPTLSFSISLLLYTHSYIKVSQVSCIDRQIMTNIYIYLPTIHFSQFSLVATSQIEKSYTLNLTALDTQHGSTFQQQQSTLHVQLSYVYFFSAPNSQEKTTQREKAIPQITPETLLPSPSHSLVTNTDTFFLFLTFFKTFFKQEQKLLTGIIPNHEGEEVLVLNPSIELELAAISVQLYI